MGQSISGRNKSLKLRMGVGIRKACTGIQTTEISAEERDLLSLTAPGALGKRELHPQCLVASEVVALC